MNKLLVFVLLILLFANINIAQNFQSSIDSITNVTKPSELNEQLSKAYITEAEKVWGANLLLGKEYGFKSFDYAKLCGNDTLIGKSGFFLTEVYNFLGDPDSSLFFAKKTKIYIQRIKDLKNELFINGNILRSYVQLNMFDSAYAYINESDLLLKKNDSLKKTNFVFHKLYKGNFFLYLKIYDLALKEYFEAKFYIDSTKTEKYKMNVLGAIGAIHLESNNYSEGIKTYKQVVEMSVSALNKADAYSTIAKAYFEINKFDSSFYFYKKAIEFYNSGKSGKQNLNIAYLGIVELWTNKRNNIAIRYLNLIEKNTLKGPQKCRYLYLKSKLQTLPSISIFYANQSKECLEVNQDIELKKNINYYLYKKYREIGDVKKSLEAYELYTSLNDSIFNKEKALALQKVIVENIVKDKDNEIKLNNIKAAKEKADKDKWMWRVLFILFFILLCFGVLYFLYRNQKQKNTISEKNNELLKKDKELLKKENQEIKKELTNVSFESDRNKEFLEATKEELKKIRLSNDKELKINSLYALTNQFVIGENNKREFQKKISGVKDEFFEKLDNIAKLTKTEKKLAALLKLDMTTKEIAPVLNVSEKSIEIYRSRLRKKLDIPKNTTLDLFFNS